MPEINHSPVYIITGENFQRKNPKTEKIFAVYLRSLFNDTGSKQYAFSGCPQSSGHGLIKW